MAFEDIIGWMQYLTSTYLYLGVFLISLIGALSIFVPIPYTVVIFTLGAKEGFEPFWIAVAAGVGSGVGEFSGYLLGLGSRRAISKKYKRKAELLVRVFSRYGPVMIFLFALTPLPDDLLFIPLGMMRYSILKALVPAVVGKFFMNLIVAYGGRFTNDTVRQVFGVESDTVSMLIGMVVAIVLFVIVFVVMFKFDWEQYLERHMAKAEGELPPTGAVKPMRNREGIGLPTGRFILSYRFFL